MNTEQSEFSTGESETGSRLLTEQILGELENKKGLFRLQGLTSASQAFFLAAFFLKTQKNYLVIAPDAAEAEKLFEDIKFFIGENPNVFYLPQFETLPYEPLSHHPEISAVRMETLSALGSGKGPLICVTTPGALSQKCAPQTALKKSIIRLKVGDEIGREELSDFFVSSGYVQTDPVEEPGTFAFRGGILDCYPSLERGPVRVEFFGDEVEYIRRFDIDSQRSLGHEKELTIFPVKATSYLHADIDSMLLKLEELERKCSAKLPQLRLKLENREFFPAIEHYLPFFYERVVSPIEYLPGDLTIVQCEPEKIDEHIDIYRKRINDGCGEARGRGEYYPGPDELYLEDGELRSFMGSAPGLEFTELPGEEEGRTCVHIGTEETERFRGAFGRFIYDCRNRLKEGFSTLVVVHNGEAAKRIKGLFAEEDLGVEIIDQQSVAALSEEVIESGRVEPLLAAAVGALSAGFVLSQYRLVVITEEEIFGRHVEAGKRKPAVFFTDFADVKPGDYVVHRDHGIGVYHGTKGVSVGDLRDEYLELEYADHQSLFLPISSVYLIEKYSGSGGPRPTLDRMGGKTWAKTRAKVKKGILKMAKVLLELYAKRQMEECTGFSKEDHFGREFADSFEFTETPDQAAAIADVMRDMELEKPMDRLICGDVGYGKTEVALRAAFKAALDGKQTAILCPTTLLANQHFETFKRRLAPFAANVEMISRFVSKTKQKEVLEGLKGGKVDIIIGTHRILQKDVEFFDLGLLVIDEEQRFGVTHKEKLKKIRTSVDVITLTATPIPRTLHMSISGIRDISVINTPPSGRLSIKTFIRKFDNDTIREAVNREMSRGGQVFFVHNRVETIDRMRRDLEKLLPNVRIATAHGQMPSRELEKTMDAFIKRKIDLLLCTTIIESGLDIPSANTIILNTAEKFGLAQLYQMRGRVGRDRHRAYAYLLVPKSLSVQARKRLKAIEELTSLGSGFKLAARDMEIRGAGNLLGSQQSGNITAVGFETYCRMLSETVEELKKGAPAMKTETKLRLDFTGKLEESYVPSLEQRMNLYSRLYRAAEEGEIRQIGEELADRFGPMPESALKLMDALLIRIGASRLGIEKVEISGDSLSLFLDPNLGNFMELISGVSELFAGSVEVGKNGRVVVGLGDVPDEERASRISRFLLEFSSS